jgi:hypothetical protein
MGPRKNFIDNQGFEISRIEHMINDLDHQIAFDIAMVFDISRVLVISVFQIPMLYCI